MNEFTEDELRKLAAGFHPYMVNRDWGDCETVIKLMANKLLTILIDNKFEEARNE